MLLQLDQPVSGDLPGPHLVLPVEVDVLVNCFLVVQVAEDLVLGVVQQSLLLLLQSLDLVQSLLLASEVLPLVLGLGLVLELCDPVGDVVDRVLSDLVVNSVVVLRLFESHESTNYLVRPEIRLSAHVRPLLLIFHFSLDLSIPHFLLRVEGLD